MRQSLHARTYLLSTPCAGCPSVNDEPLVVSVPKAVVMVREGAAADWADSIATLRCRRDLEQTLLTEPVHSSNKKKKKNEKSISYQHTSVLMRDTTDYI